MTSFVLVNQCSDLALTDSLLAQIARSLGNFISEDSPALVPIDI